MDIRELKLFLKLSETLHYTKTSHLMAISPSALSRTIQRMEDQVGQKLFFRDNRGVVLTPAGSRFREYALSVLEDWQKLQNDLSEESRDVKGDLIVYSSVTGCYTILPDLLEKSRLKYPGIHINLKTGSAADAVASVMSGLADLSVAAEPDSLPENLVFLSVTSTPLQLIAPVTECHLTDRLQTTGTAWYDLPLILPEKGLSRKRLDRFFKAMQIQPEVYAEVDGNEAIIALVSLGFGLGVVPSLVRENSLIQEKIKVLPDVLDLEPYNVGICVNRRKSQTPILRAFTSLLSGVDGDSDEAGDIL
ncbi:MULTISPECIES: HTH-type transcriptional activator IlvY [unclassified Oceanispirochaeta]|uniref:HTH-type transcriptional activator IlvY n=1 Tax=unclassified Oceanispirochaeta TaxID=2635722 RepID=UPI000E0915AD|nr:MULTISPECIES: HTH-type transcriptional activator IlvY [unclassified Oceanispirochaeta]MBF9017045.1 HTH-type transcriptional activator IlvY [Oceanispirochaeta sp. M2]NPD73494.1 HTH-type transcriptional activator IlvY [Oceanispirochaeta sp. M1]RDG30785.1 HTH-type transcriptional activator IlvY [Oceanispirochaeta sp. M1]